MNAEADRDDAGAKLAALLDADDVEQGDDLAIAASPSHAADDIDAALAEAAGYRAKANEEKKKARDRLARAIEARDRKAAQRSDAGLPAPPPFPRAFDHEPIERKLAVIRDRVANGFTPSGSQRDKANRLEREATDIRAGLEQARIEREQLEAEREHSARQEQANRVEQERATREQRRKENESIAAQQSKRLQLAAAHKARERAAAK